MSRAFVNEDSGGKPLGREAKFELPSRDDPGFHDAAAMALLTAAIDGDTEAAEDATGYYWGADVLRPAVERILSRARAEGAEELVRSAERYLR